MKTISGQILDTTTGQPIVAVNVYASDVNGTQVQGVGDVTGADGRFRFRIPENVNYVAGSHITYGRKVWPVSTLGSSPIKFMAPNNTELDEVVVTPNNQPNTQPTKTTPKMAGLFGKKSFWFSFIAIGLALSSVKSNESKKSVEAKRNEK